MPIIQANIPDELRERGQWLIWRYQVRDGKSTKVPHTTMGYRADVTNADHWSTFDRALKAAARPSFADGIGFVFTPDDPYCGMDLDTVWRSDADEGAPWAEGIVKRFNNTYQEESPSGKGVKIWCRAKAPRCGKWAIESGAIEVYDRSRFFTVTSRSNGVIVITDHQADVDALVSNLDQDRPQSQSRAIPNVIPKGQRHPTLVSLAGTMFRRGMGAEAIEAALQTVNQHQCDPPYEPEHIQQIVQSLNKWSRI